MQAPSNRLTEIAFFFLLFGIIVCSQASFGQIVLEDDFDDGLPDCCYWGSGQHWWNGYDAMVMMSNNYESEGWLAPFIYRDVTVETELEWTQFEQGDYVVFNLRNTNDHITGSYWSGILGSGQIGIGGNGPGGSFTSMIGFLPNGPLQSGDLVHLQSSVIGPTIKLSAWLADDPSSIATISWTDPLNRYPVGDRIGFGAGKDPGNPFPSGPVETSFHFFKATTDPWPTFVYDDFEDGNIVDDSPAYWGLWQNGSANPVPGALVMAAESYQSKVAMTPFCYQDVVLETAFVWNELDDGSGVTLNMRNTPNDGEYGSYWAGMLGSGQIGVGHDNVEKSIDFLPSGAPESGDIFHMRAIVIGATIELSVWPDGDPSAGATVSWTDPANLYPVGDHIGFGVGANPGAYPPGGPMEVSFLSFRAEVLTAYDADFNSDGIVDSNDLAAWQAGFGAQVGALKIDGDYDNDGDVDGDDFLGWQAEFHTAGVGAATSRVIPEPGGLVICSLAIAAGCLIVRRCKIIVANHAKFE